jgi:hypothetical protein
VWKPTIVVGTSYTPRGEVIHDKFQWFISSYQHESVVNGGWWAASITFETTQDEGEDWLEVGLNRHIEVCNPGADVVWEGFVNQVTLSLGTLSAVRGPLIDVSNRVSVVYSPILDATVAPPIEGSETTTTIADDADSQLAYAILEEVIGGGSLLDDGVTDDAVLLRDTYLAENKDPQTGEDLNIGGTGTPTVTIDLLGYVHRFGKWGYSETTAATIQVATKIQNVITADPNGMFSTDYSRIDANAVLTSQYDDDNRKAMDVLDSLVSLGDASNNRYSLGVYANRQVIYAVAPTVAKYQHAIGSNAFQVITFSNEDPVDPWDIVPAQWTYLNDFLVGRDIATTLRDDPRYVFIESVRFTAPIAVNLQGGKVSRLPQLLARLSG